MNGEEKNGKEKEKGGRVNQEDWQLVSVAWPLKVRLQVFLTGLKEENIKELEC